MTAQCQEHRRLSGQRSGWPFQSITPTTGIVILLGFVGVVWVSNQSYEELDTTVMQSRELRATIELLNSAQPIEHLFDETTNAEEMAQWRQTTAAQCVTLLEDSKANLGTEALAAKLQLEQDAIQRLSLPDDVSTERPAGHQDYAHCKNAFIDLGTNIGDSIGYFIDNSLDVCSPMWLKQNPRQKINQDFPRPHVDVSDAKIYNDGLPKANPLFGMLQREMNKDDSPVRPESFCVYGMEGNPTFTNRLQKLENFVMDMRPRPVQHLHIHTESVVTAVDGPSKLYLDKTSVQENFWGSSILSSQQDAQKSAKELNDGEVFSADVQGVALSSLVKNTMLPFSSEANDDSKTGGLLIIKMDVEGAEYQVLKEVASSGVLCEYVKMGNRVYFIVEYHNMSITDAKERRREKEGHQEAKKKLEECGIEFGTLQANWH